MLEKDSTTRKMRLGENTWKEHDEWHGAACRSWILHDHCSQGRLYVGLEILLVARAEDLMPNNDRFQLGKYIGGGGMGSIYEVKDTQSGDENLLAKVNSEGLPCATISSLGALGGAWIWI